MKEKEKTAEELVKKGYDVMNEVGLLATACDAMMYKFMRIPTMISGLSSLALRRC